MSGDPEESLEFDDGYVVLRVAQKSGRVLGGECFSSRAVACGTYEKWQANDGDCVALVMMKLIVRKHR